MVIDPHPAEYLKIHRHLRKCGIGVPAVRSVLRERIIIEDLGDRSLYALMKENPENWRRYYRSVIAELTRMQVRGRMRMPFRRRYDLEHMRWEQEYFQKYFLGLFCRCPKNDLRRLAAEFRDLRHAAAEANKPFNGFFMHRDFQSQNIIFRNRRPRIIDFQSARIGPLTYDLASLLRDPYVRLPAVVEPELINYYLQHLRLLGIAADPRLFYLAYRLTAVQRIMQALGAFVNLGINQNKKQFLAHIPRGIRLLMRGLKDLSRLHLMAYLQEATAGKSICRC